MLTIFTTHLENNFWNSQFEESRLINRQLVGLTSNSKQQVDDFIEELTFQNHLINTLCQMR